MGSVVSACLGGGGEEWRTVTYRSMLKNEVPKSTVLRDCGCAILHTTTGTRSAYRTAKTMEGAKSRESGTPPTGAGNSCVELEDMR